MGISSQTARLILREHLHRPITGRILSIGRQTVHLTPEQALDMVRAELGILPLRGAQDIELDHSTRGAQSRRYIGDKAFYSLFTDAKYHCVDQSSYEGADIVFDICSAEIPSHLENAFDFIFDGSTLDNVFDPASAIRNLTKVSRNDGGRVFHVDRVSRRHNVYTAFALSWFHDYYAINNFRDCQVYLAQWDGDDQITSRWDFYHYCPLRSENDDFVFFGQDSWYFAWRPAHAVVIAEKSNRSSWNANPIQYEYRPRVSNCCYIDGKLLVHHDQLHAVAAQDPYLEAAMRFRESTRPPILRAEEKVNLPSDLLNYAPEIVYCGSLESLTAKPRPTDASAS